MAHRSVSTSNRIGHAVSPISDGGIVVPGKEPKSSKVLRHLGDAAESEVVPIPFSRCH